MFDNIGEKIKALAALSTYLGIGCCIAIGIILMCFGEAFILIGVLVAGIGSLISWVSSFLLYGFGELISSTMEIRDNFKHQPENKIEDTKQIKKDNVIVRVVEDFVEFYCPRCGEKLSVSQGTTELTCPWCDNEIKVPASKI